MQSLLKSVGMVPEVRITAKHTWLHCYWVTVPTGPDCLEPAELWPEIGCGSMLGYLSLARPTCRGWEGKVGSLSSRPLNMHDVCFYLIGPEILIELAFTGWHLTGERGRDRERKSERERGSWRQGWSWCGQCVSGLLLCQLTCLCIVLFVMVASCRHTGCRGWLADANDMAPVVIYASYDDSFLLCVHAACNMTAALLCPCWLWPVREAQVASVLCSATVKFSHCICVSLLTRRHLSSILP